MQKNTTGKGQPSSITIKTGVKAGRGTIVYQ